MDFTPEESEQLQREWIARAEICRRSRHKEHVAFIRTVLQVVVSMAVSWLFVFGVAAWVVSFILPFKPVAAGKTTFAVQRDSQKGVSQEVAPISYSESSVLAFRR
jgi:hypothetical protein